MLEPKTAADVMALPELHEYRNVVIRDEPTRLQFMQSMDRNLRIGDTVRVPTCVGLQLSGTDPDSVYAVAAPDGNWRPVCIQDQWFRKRIT